MSITAPPVGARVRHTMTYADGTVLAVEGIVMPYDDGLGLPNREPFVNISKELELSRFLVDRPEFTVALEVLEPPPCPPEPADGYYLDKDGDVWRLIDDEGVEVYWSCGNARSQWGALYRDFGPLVRLIPDPADSAPALPWELSDIGGDKLEIDFPAVSDIAAGVSINKAVAVFLGVAAAREAAAVLLRAVRQFEERQVEQS